MLELSEIINTSTKKTNGIIYNVSSVLAVSERMSTPVSCEITLLSLVPPNENACIIPVVTVDGVGPRACLDTMKR